MKDKSFTQMWQEAIVNDPYWQFEDLLEDNPKEAERIWHNMRVSILAQNRVIKAKEGEKWKDD